VPTAHPQPNQPTGPGDWCLDLATRDDDAAIRRLLANNPVPGRITLSFEREPSFFLGCGTLGHFCQVGVARRRSSGEVVGVGCRAVRRVFVNGRAEDVGYVGQLRVDRAARGAWLGSQALRFLRQLHGDGRAGAYLATITEENAEARGLLVDRPRRHFPIFREVDRLHTLALVVRTPKPWATADPSQHVVGRGAAADLPEIVAFLRREGAAKQFFPVYDAADVGGSPATLGFGVEDFAVARTGHGGDVVGIVGLWNQSAYKQTVVRGYAGALRWLRPLYNAGARLRGGGAPGGVLPAPGRPLRSAYASFVCVAGNDPAIFRGLLRHVYALAAARGYAYLLVGLTSRDPLLPVAREYPHIAYYSRLYTVGWDDQDNGGNGGSFHDRLDARVPHVEIATL
jgi:hypothetical protein